MEKKNVSSDSFFSSRAFFLKLLITIGSAPLQADATYPPSCANSSGVFPFLSFGARLARFATKTAATVRCPFIAAQWSAVNEPRSLQSTFTPALTAISTLMASPLAAGPWMVPSRLAGGMLCLFVRRTCRCVARFVFWVSVQAIT